MKAKPVLLILIVFVLFLLVQNYRLPESGSTDTPAQSSSETSIKKAGVSFQETAAVTPEQSGAMIAFTFDDGYLSDYEIAYPILKKYNIRGTSYIIPKYQDEGRAYAMSWDQVKEMMRYGWVFGCHTYAHTDLKKMSAQDIVSSMKMVNEAFARQGLEAPIIHAFPFGNYNQQAIDAMKPYRVQMRKAYYEQKFIDLKSVNPYEIDSCSADMRTEKRLKEHEALVDKACEKNAVLVFRCHCLYRSEVNDMGEWPVQTDSRLFEQLVAYCVQKGCRFITMTDLIDMYSPKT